MKRTVVILAGFGILAGAYLWAQTPGNPPPAQRPLQTRIALINMVQVLKNYKKFTYFESQIRDKAQAMDKAVRPMKDRAEDLKKEYSQAQTPPARKEQIESEVRRLSLELQVKEDEMKKDLFKMNGDAAKQIYMEVEEAVSAYARANNFELVLFYNDAVTRDDFYHPENIKRKLMTPAAVMPMVVSPGMDVSDQIVANLNQKYTTSAAPVPPRPATPVVPPKQ